jgi:hypothetical protein
MSGIDRRSLVLFVVAFPCEYKTPPTMKVKSLPPSADSNAMRMLERTKAAISGNSNRTQMLVFLSGPVVASIPSPVEDVPLSLGNVMGLTVPGAYPNTPQGGINLGSSDGNYR